jgi:hypothetical protein
VNSVYVALLNLTLGGTLKVVDGGGLSNATYTLFTYGGTLSYNGLTVGAKPGSSICVVDTNTFGQVNLVVTLPPFQIISIVQSNNNVVVGWTTSGGGINFVQATAGDGSGGYSTTNFQDISGQILVGAGTTNTYTESGGAISGSSRFYRIRFPQ